MRFYDNLLGHDLVDPKLELNKRGHRCKDIEDVNLHNYMLFVGDNVALDFNSPMSDTYPYLISKKLEMDYYNLSIFNGGIDVIKYNLLAWYYKYPKPKFIVLSTEFLNSIVVSDETCDNIQVADYNDEAIKQIMTAGETFGFFPARHLLTQAILLRHIISPIYQIQFKDKTPLFNEGVVNIKHDSDIFDHQSICKLVVEKHSERRARLNP